MATDSSNSTSSTDNDTIPASQCIPWIAVLITESLLIVIVNLVTVIVFGTQHQLQRRGTYVLIRNLAIIDLLVGIVSGPLQIERIVEGYCNLWGYESSTNWASLLKLAFLHLFSFASLGNLVAISLERMHAIMFPSKHLFMKKWVYKVIIAVIWLTAIIRESAQIVLLLTIDKSNPDIEILMNSTLYFPYYLISLLIICVTYITIFIKIRCSPQPHPLNSSVMIKERQLTFTLFIVTITSVLSLLPVIFLISLNSFSLLDTSSHSYFHFRMVVIMFFLANSLVNPIIYSMRIQGFRAGLTDVFCSGNTNHVHPADFPLRQF